MRVEPLTLESARVRLEPLTESHYNALCEIALDPEIWRWYPFVLTTPDDIRPYLAKASAAQVAGTESAFATIEKATGKMVGSTRYMNIDMQNRRVEIGSTWIARPWQRTAINTEAKYLMLRHAFEKLGCIRVELKTDALNQKSRAAILRIGAREEGTLRQHMIMSTGRLRDSVYFSILDSEWPQVKTSLEAKIDRGL